MKFPKLIGAFVAIVMLMAGSTTAYADGLCKNVQFKFTNRHQMKRPILVDKVMYLDPTDKKWRTEDIPDTPCDFEQTCTTPAQDLGYVEGKVLDRVRFVYKESVNSSWGPPIEGGDKIPERKTGCVANITYGPAPDGFIITGR